MSFSPADHAAMQQYFASGATRSLAFRRQQLLLLKQTIRQYEQPLLDALFQDLHKSPEEAYATEIGFLYTEIDYLLRHLRRWMAPQKVAVPLVLFRSSGKIIRDPLGVVLVIAPWNYPFQLLFSPLAGAIAGGNCAVLKPSEYTPRTAQVMETIIRSAFEPAYVCLVQGEGATVVPRLLASGRLDHLFFTGSTPVGTTIATLAAQQLVPCTLELGGKSPCIVEADAHIPTAAARIAWGKFTNAGQTCVAPDYLLVHASRYQALLDQLQQSILRFYGPDPSRSPDYGRIVNTKRFDQLASFLQRGKIVAGGITDRASLYLSPTLMEEVQRDDAIMQEEIFGPILPVFAYREKEEALSFIQQHPNPLSLYLFSNNRNSQRFYTERVAFGGGCINNTLVHLANPALPFGGVGLSGTGQYHGRFSFDTFTRPKGLLQTRNWPDPPLKYPPYAGKLKWLKRFFK